jgi:hypothetical protein
VNAAMNIWKEIITVHISVFNVRNLISLLCVATRIGHDEGDLYGTASDIAKACRRRYIATTCTLYYANKYIMVVCTLT